MADKPPIWEQLYAAYKRRNRTFIRQGTEFVELMNGVACRAKVVTDPATGIGRLDIRGMKFKSIVDAFLQPISANAQPANEFRAYLVGEPTVDTVTIQTIKPAVNLAGLTLLPVPVGASVYVLVLGIQ